MKKEFDLKIDGGTLESIKIDSSNSLIVATYKRDVDEFKAGDILIDAHDEAGAKYISIFKDINEDKSDRFSTHLVFDILYHRITFGSSSWDKTENNRLATDEEKQLLFDALKKQGKRWNADKLKIEELDISEIVVDLKTAIDYLDCPRYTYNIDKKDKRLNKFEAQITLQLIAEAWNKFDEFEADWADSSQQKFSTGFSLDEGELQIDYVGFVYVLIDSQNANFSFKTEERAKQFTEQFIDLFKIALGI